jgi:hypothetical protein
MAPMINQAITLPSLQHPGSMKTRESANSPVRKENITDDPPETLHMACKSIRSRELIVGTTLVGHERTFFYMYGERIENHWGPTTAYFPDEQKMISGSRDNRTTRLWDLQAGKEMEDPRKRASL